MKKAIASPLFLFCLIFLLPGMAGASATDGTIDSTNKWAWSESAGWIDFGTTEGNVHVTDSALTGYAYGETIGWISLNCSNTSSCDDNSYAVSNNDSGTLSGYAWSETAGWIHFAPSGGGVSINSSGVFSGTAYSETVGWIVFGTDHPVTTDWRPSSARTSSSNSSGGNGAPVSGPMSFGYINNSASVLLAVAPPLIPAVPVATSSASSAAAVHFVKNRRAGESGTDIKALQVFLNTHGFIIAKTGPGSPGRETNMFGTLTYAAVVAFQKAKGIVPHSGYFGPLTRAYINNNY